MSNEKVAGEVDPRFAPMREVLAGLGEGGNAVAVEIDGEPVVDLWTVDGWSEDSVVHLFSGSKPIPALCVLRLVDRGALELDQRVTSIWPEYGAAGKEATTVRHLLAHTAGMVAFAEPQEPGVVLDWDRCIAAIEAEPPEWEPGTKHGEHALLYGHLLGELVRRVDGRPVREFFRAEFAEPLGLDVHVGVDGELARRAADVTDPGGRWRASLEGAGPLMVRALENPPALMHTEVVNSAAWRGAEIPAVNVHASARGLARLYSALIANRDPDGAELLSSDLLEEALTVQVSGQDEFFLAPVSYGLGWRLDGGPFTLAEFGYGGTGGSVAIADRSRGVSFAFVTRSLGGFDRAMALEAALVDLL